MKNKYLESLKMNISNSYCEERKHYSYLQSAQLI